MFGRVSNCYGARSTKLTVTRLPGDSVAPFSFWDRKHQRRKQRATFTRRAGPRRIEPCEPLQMGETARARAELEAVVNAPFDPAWAFEIERDQRIAQERLS